MTEMTKLVDEGKKIDCKYVAYLEGNIHMMRRDMKDIKKTQI